MDKNCDSPLPVTTDKFPSVRKPQSEAVDGELDDLGFLRTLHRRKMI